MTDQEVIAVLEKMLEFERTDPYGSMTPEVAEALTRAISALQSKSEDTRAWEALEGLCGESFTAIQRNPHSGLFVICREQREGCFQIVGRGRTPQAAVLAARSVE